MPFNLNPTTNSVVYTPGEFFSGKVLLDDYMTDNTAYGKVGDETAASNEGATLRDLSDLNIPVGKYERLILKYKIFFNSTDNADFKYEVALVDSAGSDITPAFVRATDVYIDPTASGTTGNNSAVESAINAAQTCVCTGSGNGVLDLNIILKNTSTQGTLKIQYAQNTNHADRVTIYAGSYVEHQRW